jgi:hypothetical protein
MEGALITTKVTGFDQLGRQLKEAQEALTQLEGKLGTVSFDPNDPSSIEAAVQRIEKIVDARLGAYVRNPIIGPLIDGLKEKYREGILERAARVRLEQDGAP